MADLGPVVPLQNHVEKDDETSENGVTAETHPTPTEPETTTSDTDDGANVHVDCTPDPSVKDNELITEAGRKLRTLLVDALDELRQHAPVKLSANFKISIADRRTFDLTVASKSLDDDRLIIKINPSAPQVTTSIMSHKRSFDELNSSAGINSPKRQHLNGHASSSIQTPPPSDITAAARQPDQPASVAPPEEEGNDDEQAHPDEPDYLRKEFRTLSKQVRWVEQCRRSAAADYRSREERWRVTSASFHDENRIKRERHEAWVAGEMSRQANMLAQLMNDVKALYPMVNNSKWNSTSPHPLYGQPVMPATEIVGVPYHTPPNFTPPYTQRWPKPGDQVTRGRPRGRPRGS